nr:translocation/assembly module TamB domain-containing protein [uncultured Kingella sp.]
MTEPSPNPQATENPVVSPSPSPAPQKTKKSRRLLKYTLGTVIILLGASAGGAAWLLNTNSGLRFAVYQLPKLADVHITSKTLTGSVLQGINADELRIITPSADIDISTLYFQWQPSELWQRHLHINQINAGNVHIQSKPTPPQPKGEPMSEPDSISLPMTIALDNLTINSITQDKRKTELVRQVQASYVYDHKEHRLKVGSLKNYWSSTQGELAASTAAPFALSGDLFSDGELEGIAVTNGLNLSGSLNNIMVNTALVGNGIGLHANTQLRPFAKRIDDLIGKVNVVGQGINPKAFMPNLPEASLYFTLGITPDLNNPKAMLRGALNLRNELPKTADNNGIPVRLINGIFNIDDSGDVKIDHIQANLLQKGSLKLSGDIRAAEQTLNLAANIAQLNSSDIISTALKPTFNGDIKATGTFTDPQINWQLATENAQSTGNLKIQTDTKNAQRTLLLENANIKANNGGEVKLAGKLELFQNQKLALQASSQNFNPSALYPSFPQGNINGKIQATGEIAKQQIHSELNFAPSTLSGTNLSGSGVVDYRDNHLSRADLAIHLGSNHINTKGAYGKQGDNLALDINAPNLNLFGFGLQGALTAKGSLKTTANGYTQVDANLNGQARGFALGEALRIQNLDFKIQASPSPTAPLNITLNGNHISASGIAIDNINASLNGTQRQHQFKAQGSLKIDNKPLTLRASANGGLNEKIQWQGNISELNIAGALNLRLQNTMRLEAGAERVILSSASWQALGGSLNLDQLTWSKQAGLVTKGHANNLSLEQLHNFYTPPIEHNLTIAADWDLSYTQSPRGYLNLRQQGGDIILPTARKQPLNLQNFVLKTTLDGRGIHNNISADTRYGKATGDYTILQAFGNGKIVDAPVSGKIQVSNDNLESLKSVMPVGHIIQGSLAATAQIAGTVSTPKLSGTVNGENLYYRNRQVGIILDNGSLKSHLDGQRWHIDSLVFDRKGGKISLTGDAAYVNNVPDVNAKITVAQYPILDQASRRLTVSGNTDISYNSEGITLTGSLKTDMGRFGFQESSAPTLDDDVIIIGEVKPPPAPPLPLKLNLEFDLNDRLFFVGEGLRVLLGGKLNLTSHTTADVQAVGSIHIIRGQYKAYGQDLVVKKGTISFVGPLTKPNLNIRAERRASPVGAGVEVLGNLEVPRVSLVADEPMSEKDKLSWLILNRASSGSDSDNAALATAVSAYLAGKFNDKIGFVDDFGLTTQQTRNTDTGELNPAQQVLTFGKQLTQDLYLGYEVGLGQANQTVKLVYQLSRAFQAIARIGTLSSGGELKYIKRFD